jgi:hypothetical protein
VRIAFCVKSVPGAGSSRRLDPSSRRLDRSVDKDGRAPIFEYSDLGVVGDLHEIVPKLTGLVRARG